MQRKEAKGLAMGHTEEVTWAFEAKVVTAERVRML